MPGEYRVTLGGVLHTNMIAIFFLGWGWGGAFLFMFANAKTLHIKRKLQSLDRGFRSCSGCFVHLLVHVILIIQTDKFVGHNTMQNQSGGIGNIPQCRTG